MRKGKRTANDTVLIEISAPPLGAERLRKHNLHILNVLPIPQRLEHQVREAEHCEIVNQFLPEVMIDPAETEQESISENRSPPMRTGVHQ